MASQITGMYPKSSFGQVLAKLSDSRVTSTVTMNNVSNSMNAVNFLQEYISAFVAVEYLPSFHGNFHGVVALKVLRLMGIIFIESYLSFLEHQ